MIVAIARKEFREITRDGRFRWLAAACLLLMIAATLGGWQSVLTQLRDRTAAVQSERANFLEQGARNPHAAAHFGQYAFRPVLLPAAIDPGAGAFMGSMIWMEAHRQNLPEFRPAEDSTGSGRSGRLSVAWVLQFVVPLLIVVSTYAAIAGEREQGTLGLALSQGPGLPTLLSGKGLAVAAILLALLLPLVALSVCLFAIVTPGTDTPGVAGRLAWMGLAYGLYLMTFVGLSLLVSTVAKTRRTAFLTLVAAWLFTVVAVPRVAADLAARVHPTPTPTAFWSAIRRGDGLDGAATDPRARAAGLRRDLKAELLARYRVDSIAALPVNFTAVFLQRLEEQDAPIFDYNFERLCQTYEAQRRYQQRFALLSPLIAVRALSMAMAGTDPYAQYHFSRAAEDHRRQFVRQLNEKQAVDGAGKGFYVAPADSWEAIPTLHYHPPPTGAVLRRHRADLAVLALWAALPFLLAQRVARKARHGGS